jgi:hypothetical protein
MPGSPKRTAIPLIRRRARDRTRNPRAHPLRDREVDVGMSIAAPPPSAGAAPRFSTGCDTASSTNEFQAPQSGQRPSHFWDWEPHSVQA